MKQSKPEVESTSMLRGYDHDHEYQHSVIEPEKRPHFTRDDVPIGVILDHPARGKKATRS